MTGDAINLLLAEIRRSGGDVRLVGADRLKLVARTSLLPELTERVRAAKPRLRTAVRKLLPRNRKGEGYQTPVITAQRCNTLQASLYRIAPDPGRQPTGAPAIAKRWTIGGLSTRSKKPRGSPGTRCSGAGIGCMEGRRPPGNVPGAAN